MSDFDGLDLRIAHIVTAPHQVAFSSMWWSICTCGEEALKGSEQECRDLLARHRAAHTERERRARLDSRSEVERGGAK